MDLPEAYQHPVTARRDIIRVLYSVALLLLLAGCGGGGSGTTPTSVGGTGETPTAVDNTPVKPNILLIVADDLGFNDLAINNGNEAIDTPNLDQLAREGVRFTRHYATAVCSPARAALLTGRYPERLGYLPNGRGISPDIATLPEKLIEEGYTTWHIGKWHIGDLERSAWPDQQGFQHWFGFLNQWRLAGSMQDGEIQLARPRYENPWLQGDREPGRHFEGHLENILTDAAIGAITEMDGKDQPWFLNLWYYAPHTPIEPAEEFASRYPENAKGRYLALVNQLDSSIGRVLDHLDTLGAAENTIVVVVSDNGGTNRVLDNNAPFYGKKASLNEGGLRTPLLIRWPEEERNGRVTDQIVSISDIYPTLLDALSIALPQELDGHSFYRSSQDLKAPRQHPLFWELGPSYSVLSADGRWRMHKTPSIYGQPPQILLYDLVADSSGAQPLEAPPPEILAELRGLHESWYHDVHTVKTRLQQQADGTAALTGTDFQRSPGHGGYSFGIGIPTDSSGRLAAQEGIWSLHRTGNTITAYLGELTLSGEITGRADCHSIVLTGLFYRKLSTIAGEEHMVLELHIDGALQQSARWEGPLGMDDLTVPTQIGDPNVPAGTFQGPIILNVQLNDSTPITAESFNRRLCEKV